MSVAFTKEEDSESQAANLPDRPVSPHPNLVTAKGLAELEAALAEAAAQGAGAALAPAVMFERDLASGRLARPFAIEAQTGSYWLSWLKSKAPGPAFTAFRAWLVQAAAEPIDG